MKKILYFVLPAIFLVASAGNGFAQIKELKQLSSEQLNQIKQGNEQVNKIKQELNNKQKANEEKVYGEYMLKNPSPLQLLLEKATEINFKQRVSLQELVSPHQATKIGAKNFKLKLNKEKTYTLLDQKNFNQTNKPYVQYLWNEFLGKYSYEFTFNLADNQAGEHFLLINIKPIACEEPTVPYAYVEFNDEGNFITYNGMAYAMDTHSGFIRKVLSVK